MLKTKAQEDDVVGPAIYDLITSMQTLGLLQVRR